MFFISYHVISMFSVFILVWFILKCARVDVFIKEDTPPRTAQQCSPRGEKSAPKCPTV